MADTVKPTWLRTAVVSIIVMYEITKQVSYLYFFNSQSLGFNLVTTSSHIGGIFGGCALPLVNAILYMWLLQIVYMYYKVLSRNDESYTKFCLFKLFNVLNWQMSVLIVILLLELIRSSFEDLN